MSTEYFVLLFLTYMTDKTHELENNLERKGYHAPIPGTSKVAFRAILTSRT